jgi:hypothetical protein
MVTIGKGKNLFSYDVDVSRFFRANKKEAIITLREPTTLEYQKIARLSKMENPDSDTEMVNLILGLIDKTTIKAEEEKDDPVNLDYLKQFIKDNGSLYLLLYQEWQKQLPFDRSR